MGIGPAEEEDCVCVVEAKQRQAQGHGECTGHTASLDVQAREHVIIHVFGCSWQLCVSGKLGQLDGCTEAGITQRQNGGLAKSREPDGKGEVRDVSRNREAINILMMRDDQAT